MASQPSCRFCHLMRSSSIPHPSPSSHSPADEISYIYSETRRINDMIQRLHEDRAALLSRLNALQSSTRVLFPETLSLVFQHAYPAPDYFLEESKDITSEDLEYPSFHLVLSSVCSTWRRVVHSTPNLWTSISMRRVKRAEVDKWTSFLLTSFEKSGSLPLDIFFQGIDTSWINHPHLISPEIDPVLSHNFHRIRGLSLRGYVPSKWYSALGRLNGLVDLTLNPKSLRFHNPSLSFSPAAALNCLHLSACPSPLRDINTSLAPLTILSLSGVQINLCFELLLKCHKLVEFHCTGPVQPRENSRESSLVSNRVALHKLECFQWTFLSGDGFATWNINLLEHVEFPALKSLQWLEDPDRPPQLHPHTAKFFYRLPVTLESIEFVGVGVGTADLCYYISHIRYDTDINMVSMDCCSERFAVHVLRSLERTVRGMIPLPKLTSIQIFRPEPTGYGGFGDNICVLLGRVLRERKDYVEEFTLTLVGSDLTDIDPSTKNMLMDIVRDGLKLHIYDDGTDILDTQN